MTRARHLVVTGRPDPRRLERQLAAALALAGLPAPVPQFRFAPPRQWKADFAWPEARLLVEVDGGVFTRGRHTRGAGYIKDCEKLNAAVLAGWRVLRVTRPHIRRGQAVQWVTQALSGVAGTPLLPQRVSPPLVSDPTPPGLAPGSPGGRARRGEGRGPGGPGGGEARAAAHRALASATVAGSRIRAAWRGRRR